MQLKSVKLTNFRGYRTTTTIPVTEALTGIVGRNDYGKSTILEALAIFFEIEGAKADKSDMNCFSLADGDEQFEITCEFNGLPENLVLDENVATSLAQEYLLNADQALEVVKTFKASTGKLEQTAIRCQHPSDAGLATLLSQKIADLRKLGEARGVAEQVEDKRVASQWRHAIRAAAAPIACQETLLDVSKALSTDSKSIWDKIEAQLPTFALFKADRESSDGDAEAKNPLQQAVKELANELTPRFKEKPKWSFNFTLDGENGIPINKRGSGVRRLILLNFFRAEAEKTVVGIQRNVIYAIEEPETSQHPNYQMMLMRALLDLSTQPNRQIIVTTHVPALAGLVPTEGIRYVTKDADGIPIVKMPSNDVLREAAESLGVLPETGMERAKGVVLVEGKSDVTFLRHTANALKGGGHVASSLEDVGVVPILIGGCGSVKHWVTLNLADDLGLPWCVFLDSDIGGRPEQNLKRKDEVEAVGRAFYSTRKREIENYLCPDLIEAQTGIRVAFTDTCDAKKIIGQALSLRPDDVTDRFWPLMTAEMILQRSQYVDGNQQHSELKMLIENLTALVA
jgi:predicted ATPase